MLGTKHLDDTRRLGWEGCPTLPYDAVAPEATRRNRIKGRMPEKRDVPLLRLRLKPASFSCEQADCRAVTSVNFLCNSFTANNFPRPNPATNVQPQTSRKVD